MLRFVGRRGQSVAAPVRFVHGLQSQDANPLRWLFEESGADGADVIYYDVPSHPFATYPTR